MRSAARLGADAVQIDLVDGLRPTPPALDAVAQLIRAAHKRSLKLIIGMPGAGEDSSSPGPAEHLAAARQWLELGADGLDLGHTSVPAGPGHVHPSIDMPGLHALTIDFEEAAFFGAVTGSSQHQVTSHIVEDWIHVVRDELIFHCPPDAAALTALITRACAERNNAGASLVWSSCPAISGHTPRPGVMGAGNALNLLLLALPGTVYIHPGAEIGQPLADVTPADLLTLAQEADRQRTIAGSPFDVYRRALRLRRSHHLALGSLGIIDTPDPGVITVANSRIGACCNLSPDPYPVRLDSEPVVLWPAHNFTHDDGAAAASDSPAAAAPAADSASADPAPWQGILAPGQTAWFELASPAD